MKYYSCLVLLAMAWLSSPAQKPLVMRDSAIRGPQTFAIIVGISKYKFVRPLTYADKDAELFRDYLRSPGGGSVSADNIFCLLNEQANNQNFWGKGFQWLKAKDLRRGDKLFIYLAGHGDAIDEDQFFFLGYDCNPGGDKNNYLVSGAIQLFNLKKKIANETARGVEVVFIMDACRSDELPGGSAGQSFLNSAISEKKAGEIIMLATGAGQESLEDESIGNGHGLFTYYLVDGLNGSADSLETDQKVTFREIQTYVSRHVPAIAQQRFRRKQEPFFCCNENSERVISSVDPVYFRNWLKTKQSFRGGNQFTGEWEANNRGKADTLLQETYDRFYRAIRNNRLTGTSSAEDYYRQLDKKFPGSPYTLDARSTLAVEYMNVAQKLIDDYVTCDVLSRNQRARYDDAADGLEKAINYFRQDDEDFANSLYGRYFLLRSLGNQGTDASLRAAHSALAFDRNGAYAHHRLASLHYENRQYDSALYYAQRANSIAPNWPCAITTLSLVRKTPANIPTPADSVRRPKPARPAFTFSAGGGVNEPSIDFNRADWRQGNVNYADSLSDITTATTGRFALGIGYHFQISELVSLRPQITFSAESGEVIYHRREVTGGPSFPDPVRTETNFISMPLSLIVRFSKKNVTPYLVLAPEASYIMQNEEAASRLTFKEFGFSGNAGLGVEIGLTRSAWVISPELKYTQGISNLKGDGNNLYLNTISSIKRKGFELTVHFRKR
jgi:tetratricopeptide (TPR) repeat protein